jgi:cob(I)alamin adenosyltransferase
MPIYTRRGDSGETGLLLGGRVSKSDPRCEAYGATDEAVSAMGLARALSEDSRVKDVLLKVQREMFTVGAELATHREQYEQLEANFAVVTPEMTADLEVLIDEIDQQIDLPNNFIVPGASAASSALDMARSRLRTAERRVVVLQEMGMLVNVEVLRYVNRLADLLFMLARYQDRALPFEIVTGKRQ